MLKRENPEKFKEVPQTKSDSLGFIRNKMKNEPCIVIKTHLHLPLLPKQIQEGTRKPKVTTSLFDINFNSESMKIYCKRSSLH